MRRTFLTLGVLTAFAGLATATPVPKAIKAKPWVRKTIQPLPGEKVYSVDYADMPFEKVMEDVERRTGLLFLSKHRPESKFTLKANDVCLEELFAQLDDLLYPQGYYICRKSQSFTLRLADEKIARLGGDLGGVWSGDLRNHSQFEVLGMFLNVGEKGAEEGLELVRPMMDPFLEISTFGTDKLLVRGRGKELQKLLDDLGDQLKK
jgi:hypothetical protein